MTIYSDYTEHVRRAGDAYQQQLRYLDDVLKIKQQECEHISWIREESSWSDKMFYVAGERCVECGLTRLARK